MAGGAMRAWDAAAAALGPAAEPAPARREWPGRWDARKAPEWALRDWYVIAVAAGRERSVVAAIEERMGLTLFLPRREEERQPRRRRKHGRKGRLARTVERPAFPGYALVGLAERDFGGLRASQEIWRRLLSSPLVSGFLGAEAPDGERYPIRLRWAEVAAIGAAEMEGWPLPAPEAPLAVGDRVRIAEGPFGGFEAVVEVVHSDVEVTVGARLFGGTAPVRLEVAAVERVG